MNFRGLLRVPQNGEKQQYLNCPEWRWYQKYLPEDLRLQGEYIPNILLPVRRYKPMQ